MEKKEIDARTTIKAIITGFVSYGIIAIFIFFLLIASVRIFLNKFTGIQVRWLYITIPLMATFFIFFIVHTICRISTYDVFKKCKTNPDNYKSILRYLNLFFILCIILSIALFLSLLYNNLEYKLKSIEFHRTSLKATLPDEVVDVFLKSQIEEFNTSKPDLVNATIILVLGVSISFLSLINFQKKMILKYNTY